MQSLRQEFCSNDDGGREEGTEEESKKSREDGAGNEVGDEPETELDGDGEQQVGGDGEFLAKSTGDETEDYAADGDA